jgi:peptidoglycan hydrolase CwlO-like protein
MPSRTPRLAGSFRVLQCDMQPHRPSRATVARAVSVRGPRFAVALALLTLGSLAAAPVGADLQGQIDASRARDRALQSEIAADSRTIDGFQGRIDDVRARLAGIQHSLDIEQAQLAQLRSQLRDARARLVTLRLQLARDREVLARQLVGQYESPQPDLVSVVLDAQGFADLLERVDQLKRIADQNTETTTRVRDEGIAVRALSRRLNDMVLTQQHVTSAQMIQRDEVAQLKFALEARQAPFLHSRARRQAQLASLRSQRKSLEKRLASYQVRAAAAYGLGSGVPFTPGGGSYGFFPAPGTNYSVGQEPELARRLDRLGKALHLHLIGISGYRTPAHSVEVGGFANDPHTRGEASDTPGVEGVPEATLRRFGLTRPFPGAREADHIQLA